MGIRDKVRGKTQQECWHKFVEIEREIQKTQPYMDRVFPVSQKDAYDRMVKDEETGEYELSFLIDN